MEISHDQRVVYPIHNDDLERIGLPQADEVKGGDGLSFTPAQIKKARDRWEKSKHENPIKHRDLAFGVGGFIDAVEQWEKNYKNLEEDYDTMKQDRDSTAQSYEEAIERELALEKAIDELKENHQTAIDQWERSHQEQIEKIKNNDAQLAVKQTALDERKKTVADCEKKIENQAQLLSYYQNRYGVFELGVYQKKDKPKPLKRWQRFSGRVLGILLPPPEKRVDSWQQ